MARVGEGDPRWIVSQRDDGKNVNSWHWEEKDLSKQVHDELKAHFTKRELCSNEPHLALTLKEVSEISGEVTVAQRKGKIMCYFELHIVLKWEGRADGSKVEGKLTIPEVDHDGFRSDFEVQVSSKERDSFHESAEAWLREKGRPAIRRDIAAYFEHIFAQNNVGTFLKNQPQPVARGSGGSPAPAKSAAPAASPSSAATHFSWRMRWRAPIEQIFQALTDEQRVAVYTRAPAKVDPRPSGLFSLLGGSITGYYVDVTFPTQLTMQWRLASWPSQVHSSVVIMLAKEESAVTVLEFAQRGIPDGELERVRQGWMTNVFDPMSKLMGFSMELI